MSGHSKWSTIKHKKGKADAARGRLFTRLIKEVTVAARIGGGDVDGNPRLRKAVDIAKGNNMPNDNIDRAIKKGTGELEGVHYDELTYEGYGPGGTAVMVNVFTDNKNRSHTELRRIFDKNNSNLGQAGCVAWIFEHRGILNFTREGIDADALLEAALEAGALDVVEGDEEFAVFTEAHDFDEVKAKMLEAGFEPAGGEPTMVPKNTVKLKGHQAEQMIKLMELLEDHDDVQSVYANFDIPDDVMEQISEKS